MELMLYQVDAFADQPFTGNPAAVCPLTEWLPDDLMQSIAMENNLSETAFFVPTQSGYHIRWFTPNKEVDLCGHATLASAYVLFEVLKEALGQIQFESRSGILKVKQIGEWIEMDFPAQPGLECETPQQILDAFSVEPTACLKSEDYIVVFADEQTVLNATPNLVKLAELDLRGVTITSQSDDYDFVNRFFAPRYGINEDPVTGSAFTQLIPYWAKQLGKEKLLAKQVSSRAGIVRCALRGDRVSVAGTARKFMKGTIDI